MDGIQLVGIASAGGSTRNTRAKNLDPKYATSSEDEIINDPNINTVAILTRHDSHAELVVKTLKAGKHVFVEKPLAINSDQLSVISKQLKKTDNCLLMTGFNRRFAPLRESLRPKSLQSQSPLPCSLPHQRRLPPSTHWTQDPTSAVDGSSAKHVISLTSSPSRRRGSRLCDRARVASDGGKYREDNVSMTFTFPDGSIGVVDYLANGDKSFPKNVWKFFVAEWSQCWMILFRCKVTRDGKMKEERGAQDKGWVNEWKAFVKSIREGGEPPIPYEQLIGVTKSTIAAVESLRTMQTIKL
ncbi:MAG: Gfo/Idh/MocA family oxidoreductase [Anaerolineales bacterium]